MYRNSTTHPSMFRSAWTVLIGLTILAAAAAAEPVALVGATIHPVSGETIENATLVVDDGEIVALGADVTPPADATLIELSGQHVYPGFVAANTVLGLIEVAAVGATTDYAEGDEINSDLRAEVAVNADSRLLPVAVSGGVLTAQVTMTGGVITGRSAVIALEGWNWEDMTLASGIGLHLNFPATLGGDGDKEADSAQNRALETIDDALERAKRYRELRDAGTRVAYDAKLEGILPILSGDMPLWIHAETKSQIEGALDWAAEKGFENLVLVTGPDAQYVAPRLAEAGVPVILNGVHTMPSRRFEPYDMPFVAAKVLHEAGVVFAIADGGGGFGAANTRNLPFHAATAAAYGLPKDAALRSVTLTPAEILGVADRVGSLEVGKDATFFVADGDPLEIVTTIERVWIRGAEIDLAEDPQRRLYEKYRNRPRPEEGR